MANVWYNPEYLRELQITQPQEGNSIRVGGGAAKPLAAPPRKEVKLSRRPRRERDGDE